MDPKQEADRAGWLIIKRYPTEGVLIDGKIQVYVNWVKGDIVSLAVSAPKSIKVDRIRPDGSKERKD
jgi:hypothetical protein